MKKLVLVATALALSTSVHAQTFNMSNASAIVDDSRHNEMRFDRNYKDKPFSDVLTFKSLSKGWFGKWHVEFRGAYCFVDEDVAKGMVDWPNGRRMRVSGTIDTTMFGDISLDNCTFEEAAVAPPPTAQTVTASAPSPMTTATFDAALAKYRAGH